MIGGCCPSSASWTQNPAVRRTPAHDERTSASSSTTRTIGPGVIVSSLAGPGELSMRDSRRPVDRPGGTFDHNWAAAEVRPFDRRPILLSVAGCHRATDGADPGSARRRRPQKGRYRVTNRCRRPEAVTVSGSRTPPRRRRPNSPPAVIGLRSPTVGHDRRPGAVRDRNRGGVALTGGNGTTVAAPLMALHGPDSGARRFPQGWVAARAVGQWRLRTRSVGRLPTRTIDEATARPRV